MSPAISSSYLNCTVYFYPSIEAAEEGKSVGGSGFLAGFLALSGTSVLLYAITNAHVVDSCTTVGIEWIEEDEIVSWSASLIAIDYTHDLAILKPALVKPFDEEVPTFPAGLEMGTPPHPGDELWLAGYPHASKLPASRERSRAAMTFISHMAVQSQP